MDRYITLAIAASALLLAIAASAALRIRGLFTLGPGVLMARRVRVLLGYTHNVSDVACPLCSMDDLLDGGDIHECATCGHEFAKEAAPITDANGNALSDGDTVTLVKDLKISGKSGRLKAGTKIKNIRLLPGKPDHEIDCKIDGRPMLVTAQFVKRA